MKIKVCGMTRPDNIDDVAALGIDMMGFIFYPKSPRYAGLPDRSVIDRLQSHGTEPVGVFVDEEIATMMEILRQTGITTVQLHGNESIDLCDMLRDKGYRVMKAISIADRVDIERASAYDNHIDMLVLDTKCKEKGGSGRKFDWSLLIQKGFKSPFLLSGGISAVDYDSVTELYHAMGGQMMGVDLNSRFETEPGVKSTEMLKGFINRVSK